MRKCTRVHDDVDDDGIDTAETQDIAQHAGPRTRDAVVGNSAAANNSAKHRRRVRGVGTRETQRRSTHARTQTLLVCVRVFRAGLKLFVRAVACVCVCFAMRVSAERARMCANVAGKLVRYMRLAIYAVRFVHSTTLISTNNAAH